MHQTDEVAASRTNLSGIIAVRARSISSHRPTSHASITPYHGLFFFPATLAELINSGHTHHNTSLLDAGAS